jgi:dihydropteroate synthase
MGIINVTPDSFYEGSRFNSIENILRQAEKMIAEGADILDIGGQSTRPGSDTVSVDEELSRVIQPIVEIHQRFPTIVISIDSYYSLAVKEAVQAGASFVNDISAGEFDPEMIRTVASLHTPYVVMHMKGTPRDMQQHTDYKNLHKEVLDFFIAKIDQCKRTGIRDLVIDPGFGFAKSIRQNLSLLKDLSVFTIPCLPILAGLSRKSTVYKTLGITAEQSLNGTTVLNTIALENGASILRVHDVKEAKEAIALWWEVAHS